MLEVVGSSAVHTHLFSSHEYHEFWRQYNIVIFLQFGYLVGTSKSNLVYFVKIKIIVICDFLPSC